MSLPSEITALQLFTAIDPVSRGEAGPAYVGHLQPFLDAGGVYVVAHLRGGGEYGNDWWLRGRMAAKQNVFDDLFAVCERLIAEGVTSPDRLAFKAPATAGS